MINGSIVRSWFRRAVPGTCLLAAACHAGPLGVDFRGRAAQPVVAPSEVAESAALPIGAVRLGRLSAQCDVLEEWEAFEDRTLADVDCTERRLRRMLREAASHLGGDVLVGLHCSGDSSLRCQAELGRTRSEPANPALAPVLGDDIRGARGAAVRVRFAPLVANPARTPRDEEAVRDLPELPPSHRLVGSFMTACDECDELQTRDALRIAAARLGASDVVGVRCIPWGSGFQCAGSAAEARVEP